jgi:hypothetical protein
VIYNALEAGVIMVSALGLFIFLYLGQTFSNDGKASKLNLNSNVILLLSTPMNKLGRTTNIPFVTNSNVLKTNVIQI